MVTDPPFATVIAQVLAHTPAWVWAILAAITLLGLRQAREHEVPAWRLVLMPVGLGAWSLWSTAGMFGTHGAVLAAWATGWALAVAAQLAFARPHPALPLGRGRYRVPGSPQPLLAMWTVFGLRYATAVMLALQPGLGRSSGLAIGTSLACGALGGLFAARALRILRSSGVPPARAAA